MLAHRLHRALIREGETLPGHPGSRVSIPGRGTQTHTFGFPELTRQTSDFGEAKEATGGGRNPREEASAQTRDPEVGKGVPPVSRRRGPAHRWSRAGHRPGQAGVEGGAGSAPPGAQRGQEESVFCRARIDSKTCRPVPSERGKQCLGEKEKDSRQKAGHTRGDKKHPKMVNVWVDIKDFCFSFKKFP